MPLFQNSVLTKYLKTLDNARLQEKWEVYKRHFLNPVIQENIRNSKEEQYQGEFLIDLFVNVLGYTKNPSPDFNLTTEYKNVKDAKKADGAILIDGKVRAVIELKGTNTVDLGKIESQAFGYKNNQPDCIYIITSNFEKLRFYIDNAVEHIDFNLFKLSEADFRVLYLCLAHGNLANGLAKKIKDESVAREDVITKKLYKDYSQFKQELYHNLVALNPQYDPLELFKISQKLLDRFLFIFFAEDRNLLPTNLIFRINKEWRQLREMRIEVSLYDRYKIYFSDLNSGARVTLPAFSETATTQKEEHQIFAYNGGLFRQDAVLDAIKIDDEVLYKYTDLLSHYDFASEVDVNILGHIFENSLNEVDEIKAQLEGQAIDKTKTKRKKDGVFYTPKYITKYIVDNTIEKLCTEKKAELKILEEEYTVDKKRQKKTRQALLDRLDQYRKWLLQLTICDPACGSGAFLNQALDFLIEEHRYIDELQAKLFGDALVLSDIENSILENNLFGVDLNEESVEIAKLSLWLRTAKPHRKLNDLSDNIKCGNSLIDDPEVAGDKAFNWQQEFPQVFAKGGFDVVIGNPPYVQTNSSDYSRYFTYKCGDLYAYFFEMGIKVLKEDGFFSFITPSLFIKGLRYESLRTLLLQQSKIIEILEKGDSVFDDVQMPTAITTVIKSRTIGQKWDVFLKNNEIITKINSNSRSIKDFSRIMRGLEIGKDRVHKVPKDFKLLTGEDIYRYGIKSYSHIDELTFETFKKDKYFFQGKRILIRETGSRITSTMVDDELTLHNRSLYSIKLQDEKKISYYYILAILNSKMIQFYYRTQFAAETEIFPKIRIIQVSLLPIKSISLPMQQPIADRTIEMLSIYEKFHQLDEKFQRTIQRKFSLEDLPKKLQDWYKLSYGEFIKELAKKKVKLSLAEEAEWEEYFLAEQQKALALKKQIDATDKEIDQMVYALYGLTTEEIEIVENS